jgi:hypothetical protein
VKWKRGKPNGIGLWLVISSTGDLEAWQVTWDKDDGGKRRYLRMSDGMDSQPLAKYPWPPRACFGPIPPFDLFNPG